MRVTLIHNPAAGGGHPSGAELVRALRARGHTVRYRSTASPAWRAALQDPGDLVGVAGGDGTVGELLRSLAGSGSRVPITILPMGTANNVAAALGLVGTPDELVRRWPTFRPRALDVGLLTGAGLHARPFVEAVGVGVLTDMIGALDGPAGGLNLAIRRHEGIAGYVALLRRMVEAAEAQPLGVVLDGVPRAGHYLLVEALNVGLVGPRLPLAAAAPGDGRLDVLLVEESQRAVLLDWLDASPDLPATPPLPAVRARRVEVYGTGPTLTVRRDDRVLRAGPAVLARIVARHLRVLAPVPQA